MTSRSVRARLTGLVVLVAGVLAVAAATFGVDQIGDELISGDLDDAADDQLATVVDALAFGAGGDVVETELDEVIDDEVDLDGEVIEDEVIKDEVKVPESFGVSDEQQLEDLAAPLGELVGTDAFDELLEAVGDESGEPLAILTYFGSIVFFDPDTLTLEGPEEPLGIEGVVIPQSVIDELAFLTSPFGVQEIVAIEADDGSATAVAEAATEGNESEEPVEASGLVFGIRTVAGIDNDLLVFTDASDIDRGLDRVRMLAWLSVPVLVIGGGLVAWLLTGRALRPVHAMTTQVSAISTNNLHERVPQPATGDEIAELAATMNSMLDRLEIDDRRLRQFVSDASHELRSPVAVLRSEAEVAKRAPDGTTVEELADGVLIESTRLQRIVEDLLVLARGEERQASRSVDVDVDDLALREAARRRALPVDTRAVSAGRIFGNPEAVRRILTHLLDNAARHGATRVDVGVGSNDHEVWLWVDDDGPGVPESDRGRIFERFARLDDARSRDRGGAGLGLAVVAESVRSMGGQVSVEEAPIGGARFVVRWPAG